MQGVKNNKDVFITACFYLSHCTECFAVSFPQMERKSGLDLMLHCELLIPEEIRITSFSPPRFQPDFSWRVSGCRCGVIAPTPVSCNNPPRPIRPTCSAGAWRGSQTCNKQEEPRRDLLENGHFSQPSENVWSDALNYWGQRLPPARLICLRTRKPGSDIGGRCPTTGNCKRRDASAPSA